MIGDTVSLFRTRSQWEWERDGGKMSGRLASCVAVGKFSHGRWVHSMAIGRRQKDVHSTLPNGFPFHCSRSFGCQMIPWAMEVYLTSAPVDDLILAWNHLGVDKLNDFLQPPAPPLSQSLMISAYSFEEMIIIFKLFMKSRRNMIIWPLNRFRDERLYCMTNINSRCPMHTAHAWPVEISL